jgi:hypothetical protein
MYRYACFKPPRNRVRRASGLVLTRYPENGILPEREFGISGATLCERSVFFSAQ